MHRGLCPIDGIRGLHYCFGKKKIHFQKQAGLQETAARAELIYTSIQMFDSGGGQPVLMDDMIVSECHTSERRHVRGGWTGTKVLICPNTFAETDDEIMGEKK